jgi:hypothetical protein
MQFMDKAGIAYGSCLGSMTTDRICLELLRDALITVEEVSVSITAMSMSTLNDPTRTVALRNLLDDLMALVHKAEKDAGIYV